MTGIKPALIPLLRSRNRYLSTLLHIPRIVPVKKGKNFGITLVPYMYITYNT
jgi:hypothetical protein